jgi:AcrR family transcriptional regulator
VNQKTVQKENRKAELVSLIVDIILHTGKEPTVSEIISHRSISRRTLFNYYGKKGELFTEIGNEVMRRVEAKFIADFVPDERSFDTLISSIVKKRIEAYEYINPIRKILEQKKLEHEIVKKNFMNNLKNDINHLERRLDLFTQHTKNPKKTVLIIHTLISWNNWHYLRNELELPHEEVQSILINTSISTYNSFLDRQKHEK